MKNVAIYYRVSTKKQETDSQKHVLREWLSKQDSKIKVTRFTDKGISGRRDDRPAYQKMVRQALDGKFDTVVVYSLDRLSRNASSAIRLLLDLDEAGVVFISVTQPLFNLGPDMQFRTVVLALMAELAQMERVKISERVTAGMAAAKARGVRLGRKPVPDRLADRALRLRSQGKTLSDIADKCGLSVGSVHNILKKNLSRIDLL